MLGRLFSYDFKALSRILLPLNMGVLAVGIVAAIAGFAGYTIDDYSPTSSTFFGDTSTALCLITVALCVLLMFSATVATFVIALVRFYKNLFTDEGYLTLTLPVPAWQQLMSKVLAGLLWMVIDAAVVLFCLTILSFAVEGFSPYVDFDEMLPVWVLGVTQGGWSLFDDWSLSFGLMLRWMFGSLLQMLFMLMLAYTSFCIGAVVAARHKLAAGIGIFVGAWTAYGFLQGVITAVIAIAMAKTWSITGELVSGVLFVVQIAVICGCWFLSVWILKRKVNLP